MPKTTKKAKRTRRAPAAAVATQAQIKDWLERIRQVRADLSGIATGPSAHVQMEQQKDSLVAMLGAVQEEIDAALDRAG